MTLWDEVTFIPWGIITVRGEIKNAAQHQSKNLTGPARPALSPFLSNLESNFYAHHFPSHHFFFGKAFEHSPSEWERTFSTCSPDSQAKVSSGPSRLSQHAWAREGRISTNDTYTSSPVSERWFSVAHFLKNWKKSDRVTRIRFSWVYIEDETSTNWVLNFTEKVRLDDRHISGCSFRIKLTLNIYIVLFCFNS